MSFAQDIVIDAFLEKWENSKNYLIQIAETMPEEKYGFTPTPREMSFKEQLIHIQQNMDWIVGYFEKDVLEAEISTLQNDKARLIANLTSSFDTVYNVIKGYRLEDLGNTVDFFAGKKTKLQMLNLLQDHVSHHRGQLIVYLNLNDLKPPAYVGW